ncbi:hypothetical protein PHSC3_001284 [Chlamydiales bacterium STE3]|nr:hypothetical protein PHSC3_001284 [Chlamydiales bacterium STE3]
MQLYALDHTDKLILAKDAERKLDYRCLECNAEVRVRRGAFRREHFYHNHPSKRCLLSHKSLTHLAIQEHFLQILPKGQVELEKRFTPINRIADVAWMEEKIIFEIQCSFIDDEEVLSRNNDYQTLGFDVIWILHDKRYNRACHSLAEKALYQHPHYFTNMNQSGKGIIYDQFEVIEKGLRKVRLAPLQVNLAVPMQKPENQLSLFPLPRRLTWAKYFEGDLVALSLKNPESNYFCGLKQVDQNHPSSKSFWQRFWQLGETIKKLYLNLLEQGLKKWVVEED